MGLSLFVRTFFSYVLFLLFFNLAVSANDQPGAGLLPVPRKLALTNEKIPFNAKWSVVHGSNIKATDAAVTSLIDEVDDRFDIEIKRITNASSRVVRLELKAGSVVIGKATDANRAELANQAYRIKLDANSIIITANASTGLFYGVQTFLQLLSSGDGKVTFYGGTIEDWPDLNKRIIYWDDAHHLEKIKALKRAIRQAAYYKINGFALKLEGHFQYKIAAPIIEPYAYTPAEYQELTDYARRYHVELIPFLDCPAHISFILKHPEFASLRAYPNNNYQFSVINPKADELIVGMFNELFDANKGSKYVFLSTDEAYYVGKPDNEKEAAKAAGGNGALLAKYITKIANELHKRGRIPIIWGEYPLTKKDVASLPPFLVNGVYDSSVAADYKNRGIRQMIYTSTQGVEPYFPEYYNYPAHKFDATDTTKSKLITDDEMMQGELGAGRVEGLLKTISTSVAQKRADFIGSIVAGWGDSGLNPETFWLGYTTGSASGWNHEKMTSSDLSDRFFRSFYGAVPSKIKKIYEMMSSQSQFWEDSWEWAPLQLRTPIVGNSEGIFDEPRHLKDQTLLPMQVLNGGTLALDKNWNALNAQRLAAAETYLKDNEQLIMLLRETLQLNRQQQFNLRVFISIAELCRQNLQMLLGLGKINDVLASAGGSGLQGSAAGSNSGGASSVALIDLALDRAREIRDDRNETLSSVESVWYEEWFPRVLEANGRKFLDIVDDVKDHVPIRTVDMSYLVYRQLNYPMDKWWAQILETRNKIASANKLPLRNDQLNWKALR